MTVILADGNLGLLRRVQPNTVSLLIVVGDFDDLAPGLVEVANVLKERGEVVVAPSLAEALSLGMGETDEF